MREGVVEVTAKRPPPQLRYGLTAKLRYPPLTGEGAT